MAELNIDLKKLRKASAKLASKEYMFSNVRRTVNISRWKIPEELKQKKELQRRMECVLKQLQTAEQMMHEIKTTTNSCISQYAQAEKKITDNANKFM